ncbi:MAG: low molecular weight phosphotyrosine protein phosphatase [Phycisphaeraceae bacterium]|nr:low molecular weight phosphotyrosine protein phosphatase [Phycisphaeraceae bacterium]
MSDVASSHGDPTGVLFVCLGNICRSPLAKAVFTRKVEDRGIASRFLIDSCGTGGWHAGGNADPRTLQIAARYGIEFEHTARRVRRTDFEAFHLLVAMDTSNMNDLLELGAPPDRVRLMRSFDVTLAGHTGGMLDVPDPYYGGPEGFDQMYHMINRACDGLLAHLVPAQR